MKKIKHLIFVFVFFSECNPKELKVGNYNQINDTVNSIKSKLQTDSIDVVKENNTVQPIINYDSIEHTLIAGKPRTLNLIFKKITEKEFKNIENEFKNGLHLDSSKTTKEGEFFILNTKPAKYKFQCQLHCYYYSGYSPLLRSHIIRGVRDVSQFHLLDSLTGKSYILGDAEDSSNPIFSKSGKQFIIYSSSDFEKFSSISIYRRDNLNEPFNFQKYDSFSTAEWLIRELLWIDENSFALKVYDGVGFDTEGQDFLLNVRYFKVTIKK